MAAVEGSPVGLITLTKGDTLRGPAATLMDSGTNLAVDLTASTVAWRMVQLDDASVVVVDSEAANIDTAADGEVSFDWSGADVDAAGEFAAWWIRTEAGKTERFPSGKAFILVSIAESY